MSTSKILVLLSSYNGDKFIKEQIESILNQENINVYLLIRDDGSTDNTKKILSEYINNHRIEVVFGINVGFIKSFSALINMAANKDIKYDYYAFADQDDLWYPNKLYEECKRLRDFDNRKPNIVTCNSNLINEHDVVQGFYRNFDPKYTIYNVFFSTDFQGCSMVFNYEAVRRYSIFHLENYYHDNWMFLICAILGNVSHINNALFGYRVHSNNAIGIVKNKSIMSKAKKKILYWLNKQNPIRREIVNHLFRYWYDEIDDDRKMFISHYLNYRNSLRSQFWLMTNYKSFTMSDGSIKPFTIWRNLLFKKY